MAEDEDKAAIAVAAGGAVRLVNQKELDALVEDRARQLLSTGAPTPAAPAAGGVFDEVIWTAAKGPPQRLTRAQFANLPLDKRVTAILRKQLRFFLRGEEVPASTALKNY
jgi:hypothetical protein